MPEPHFNYIVTIHNKEELIHEVLVSALLCCGRNSRIYAVLDGCTDKTESILDEFTASFDNVPLVKVYAPDVHELLSINIGLRAAQQEGEGFNIVLQDDVILADVRLEEKVKKLYEWGEGKLGYVSFRLGANIQPDVLSSQAAIPLNDYIENAYGHGLPEANVLLPNRFAYRTVPIKSPVCIPTHLVREIGMLNEELAPYAHDDTDYALRVTAAGYFNGVFATRFYSDVKWGGTRTTPHPNIHRMQVRNMDIIRRCRRDELAAVASHSQRTDIVQVPGLSDESGDQRALLQFEAAKEAMKVPEASVARKIRSGLGRLFANSPAISTSKERL